LHPKWKWSTDRQMLNKWIEGKTGFPFIDCFMRELKTTGYCNHMGRETAGWFLIGDLGLDWRMAAEWFETVLVDYEPTANWFNWTYRCLPAVKHDRPPGERLSGLEILKWGTQHDPDAKYIKRWIPELAPLPATLAREPWRLGLNGPSEGSRGGSDGSLRPMPNGQFNVSRGPLEAVVSMGFDQKQAAIALYRTWEDPDAAVALLLSDTAGAEEVPDSDDEDLAKAVAMSMQSEAPTEAEQRDRSGPHGGFRYGEDYPKPIIQPVSLTNTEQKEEEARVEQAKRDEQIMAAKRHKGSGQSWSKPHWDRARQQWPAETPTGAAGAKGAGKRGGYGGSWRGGSGGSPSNADKESGGRGRRWGGREVGG